MVGDNCGAEIGSATRRGNSGNHARAWQASVACRTALQEKPRNCARRPGSAGHSKTSSLRLTPLEELVSLTLVGKYTLVAGDMINQRKIATAATLKTNLDLSVYTEHMARP